MAKKIEIYSKDENLLAIVDSDYNLTEVLAYVPALDCWVNIESQRLQEQAEKLVADHIETNEIQLNDQNDCDDFKSASYRRFVSNF